jgi:hypothetical protein
MLNEISAEEGIGATPSASVTIVKNVTLHAADKEIYSVYSQKYAGYFVRFRHYHFASSSEP